MKSKITAFLTMALMVCSAAIGAKKVHTLGDSTMAPYDESATVTRGWGMYFGNFLTDGWTSVNYAKGGRDTYTGYSELWQNAKNNVQAGDYVIITFGHNDEKNGGMDGYQLKAYYEGIGDATSAAAVDLRGSIPSTTYKENLGKIVDEVLAKNAIPVICSPVCRSYFGSDGKIRRNGRHDLGDSFSLLTANGPTTGNKVAADDHTMDYAYHSEQLAKEKNVTFVDLTTATKELYEKYGDTKCHEQLFDGDGSTHFNTTGALLVARLCAKLMKEQGLLADNINIPADLSISPATADLGDGYKGQTAMKELTLNGFELSPSNGTIDITATEGIMLSTDKTNWESSLQVEYKNATLVQNIYARVILANAGLFSGTVTAKLGEKTVSVPLTVNVIELGSGDPFSVKWTMSSSDKEKATVTGNATANDVKYEGLGFYGYVNGYGALIAPGDGKSGSWPAAGIDDDPTQYVQFAVNAPEGKKLDITSIAMKIKAQGGGSLQCHAYYSTDGFVTRKTIFASGVLNGTWNEISCDDVVTVDEGDRLLIRVYPWSKNVDKGRWICISDVAIEGQSKDAAGVDLKGSITYKLDKGGLEQGDDAVMDPNELTAGFAAKKWTAGSALTLNGTITYTGQNDEKTVQTKIYNGTGASFAGTSTADNTMTLTLTPEDGFNFVPTKVSFEAARYGTDGGTITAMIEAGQNLQELCTSAAVNRSDKSLDIAKFSYDVSNIVASGEKPLKLNFSFLGLGKTKTMGLSNVVIEGQLVGSASTTTKYALNTSVSPAEAGTIDVDPDMASFKEGTEVTLTAKKNFGYKFREWQDADGTSLGTDATLTVTMNAEKTVKAVFETIPVYTITTKVTNDADRTLGSITLVPNDHNNQYEAGTEITATAVESKILKFMQWTDQNENAGTSATRTLTVNSDMELSANYEVQDFVAVFDASVNNFYAYATTSGYPFAADLTWDNGRNASASIVKVSDGSLCYTKDGGTPVVRNREGVVLGGINGLYQNGYRTTDIAWQYQFSTKGFTDVRFEGDMAAKNMATKQWKAQVSTDGKTFTDIDGATWEMTANIAKAISIDLPATAADQETVYVRITGTGTDLLSSSYQFDNQFDGLDYCSHSESGVGNVYVLGTAEVVADEEAPVVTGTVPADNAENVSATGRITISYNERIQAGDASLKALLEGNGETMEMKPEWNSRSVSFSYIGLAYGKTYTLALPAGFTADRSGNKAAELTLTFKTMERTQPEARLYDAVVAKDGSGDHTTLQDAINAAPIGRAKPWLIFVKNGDYTEHIDIPANKPYLHIIGQDRNKTVVKDDKLCGGDNPLHVSVGATVVVNADNIFFENITLENSYGHEKQAGPQALALNTGGDRIALNNVRLLSYQDTWITTSTQKNRHYIKNSLIEGAVDFIYNGGDVFLDGDTLEINRPSGGYIVAPNHTADTKWGYVFMNNVIRPLKGMNVTDVWLGRPWHGTPKTVFINTQTFVNIPAKGWYNTMGGLPELWADYNTVDANGTPLDLSQREDYYYYTDRDTGNKVEKFNVKNYLTDDEAAQYTVKNVCGGTDGWQPDLMCEACDAPVVSMNGGRLSWPSVPYAICYVVTKDGEVAGFTTATEFPTDDADAKWQVQAVNEYGGLSKMSANVTVGGEAIVIDKEYTTYCSTQTLDFTAVEGLEAYVVTATDKTTATLSKVTTVPAATGLILKRTGDETTYTVPVATDASPIENKLVGVTTATQLSANQAYVLSGGKFVKATAGTLPAKRAYLPVSNVPAEARELTFVFGEASGVYAVETDEKTVPAQVYDLQGRRYSSDLENSNLKPGLYIVGGKKKIVK